ncbi:hypothetical protein IJU97_04570 [bacterium]|nr:hypothetical protein [bacterium]
MIHDDDLAHDLAQAEVLLDQVDEDDEVEDDEVDKKVHIRELFCYKTNQIFS